MASKDDLTVELPDGSVVGYAEVGDPEGSPVIVLPGTPGSRLAVTWPRLRQAAEDLGIRVIGVDYRGVGFSTFRPGTVVDTADMVAGLADALGLDRFAVLGYSNGGKYASACAWRFPDRVTRLVLLSSMCPVDVPGAEAARSRLDRVGSTLARRAPWTARLVEGWFARNVRRGGFPKALQMALSDADKAIAADEEFRQFFVRQAAEAYRQGTHGLAHDDVLEAQPWGFRLDEISVPIEMWHGTEDQLASTAAARLLAAVLPQPTTNFVPGQGHLLVVTDHIRDILRSAVA